MVKRDQSPEGLARKIWLAGIGAYGRAVTDAAEGVAKASQETLKRFDELAERGADIEAKAGEMLNEQVKLFDRPPLEERLAQFRAAFGMPLRETPGDDSTTQDEASKAGDEADADETPFSDDADITALKDKIAALEEQIDALSTKLDDTPGD